MTEVFLFAFGILVCTFLYVLYRSIFDRDPPQVEQSPKSPLAIRHRNPEPIKAQIRELAEIAWKTEEAKYIPDFLLTPSDFGTKPSPIKIVETFLRHAKRVTPGFTVPQTVPRMMLEDLPDGIPGYIQFSGNEVSIHVGDEFYYDIAMTEAILAHEICHYILFSSNIRKETTFWNECYTDLCMFVCGFGPVFLAGYKRDTSTQDYQETHRLGYLSDADYQLANQYVLQLRQSNGMKLTQ